MKIAIFDPYLPKFTDDMVFWWQQKGHEVRRERYYNPELTRWADVVWFETCDNNFHTASTGQTGPDLQPDWAFKDLDLTGKKIIIRVIDIEAWYGHHMNGDWNYIDDVIFMAPHIKDLVERDIDFSVHNTRTHIVPCGVNLDRYTFTEKPMGKKIAWICEKWPTKGIDYALQIMAELPADYELHTIGGWNDRYSWEQAYQEDFIERLKINFYDYDFVPDVNEWLEDKDYILSCSKKEAFGYNIAEGMAKGLVPIIHRFYGAENIWTLNTWDTIEQAVDLIKGTQTGVDRWGYRQHLIEKGYTLDAMMEAFDAIIQA